MSRDRHHRGGEPFAGDPRLDHEALEERRRIAVATPDPEFELVWITREMADGLIAIIDKRLEEKSA